MFTNRNCPLPNPYIYINSCLLNNVSKKAAAKFISGKNSRKKMNKFFFNPSEKNLPDFFSRSLSMLSRSKDQSTVESIIFAVIWMAADVNLHILISAKTVCRLPLGAIFPCNKLNLIQKLKIYSISPELASYPHNIITWLNYICEFNVESECVTSDFQLFRAILVFQAHTTKRWLD